MIIGISGVARSGKSTLANIFFKKLMYHERSFGKAVKETCQTMFGFTNQQLYGEEKEDIDPRWGFTPRYALQLVGTDIGRNQIDPDIWVKSTLLDVDRFRPLSDKWIFSDVRFRNEAISIHRRGGIVVRIEREGAHATGGIDNHASEDLSDVPYNVLIPNDRKIEDLSVWVQAIHNTASEIYTVMADQAAYHMHNGNSLNSFEFLPAHSRDFTPLPDDYREELLSDKVSFGSVKDSIFANEVRSACYVLKDETFNDTKL
jgi:hypothetical protein